MAEMKSIIRLIKNISHRYCNQYGSKFYTVFLFNDKGICLVINL